MAFCMKVAQGAVALDKCPYFSEEAKAKLSEATAPPMKTITVGNDIKLGGETVLFRHEKTLVNRNRFAVPVCTCMDEAAADQKLADIQKVDYERIGEREYIEFVMVRCEKDSADKWEDLVKKAAATGRTPHPQLHLPRVRQEGPCHLQGRQAYPQRRHAGELRGDERHRH